MITLEKINTYRRFDGDLDAWSRTLSADDASGMTDADWYLIEDLRQSLALEASGHTTPEFAFSLQQKLASLVDSKATQKALQELAL